MITEDYVSFEVAKLLKEKEFDEPVTELNKLLFKEDEKPVLKITHQKAMKWLREVHNIAINIGWGEVLEDKFQWWCIILNQKDGSILKESEYHATYEQACEAAIKYCVENLI